MATYKETYNITDHIKGDTWAGLQITIQVNSAPLDLTSAVIKAEFKHKTCSKKYELSTTNGDITITNAAGGVFQFDPAVINWAAGQYTYDIEFTLGSGDVKTYIGGTWTIVEDITD